MHSLLPLLLNCYTYLAVYLLCLNLLVYHNAKEHACTVLVSVEEEANHFLSVNPVSLNLCTTRKSYFNFELVMTLFSLQLQSWQPFCSSLFTSHKYSNIYYSTKTEIHQSFISNQTRSKLHCNVFGLQFNYINM